MAIASQEDGNSGMALVQAAAREMSTMLTISTLSEPISRGVTKLLTGTTDSLDFDRYENVRGMVGSVIGALATSALSMIVGDQVNKAVGSYFGDMVNNNPSVLESTIKSAQEFLRQSQTTVDKELLEEGEEIIDGDMVQYITYSSWGGDPESNSSTYEVLYSEALSEDDTFEVSTINKDYSSSDYMVDV
jgi:hypothetical protein